MKILLATDGSACAEEAGWFLAHMPHSDTLDLCVLTVANRPEIHGSKVVLDWMKEHQKLENKKLDEAYQRIERMFEGANARLKRVIAEGHVARTILQEAIALEADMIILGAVGHSPIERILLGSVSDFVATHAPCSVLIVRPTGLRNREHSSLNICVAYDDSEPCKLAISGLAQFDWRRNTKIDVVSTISTPFIYSDVPVEIDWEALKQSTLSNLEVVAEGLRKLWPDVNAHVTESIHIGDGLVKFANQMGTDLIVMGDTGRGLLSRFLLGSVSRYVLRHASCSVWIARKKSA